MSNCPLWIAAALFIGSCVGHAQGSNAAVPVVAEATPALVETAAQEVSVCDLKSDPDKYNQSANDTGAAKTLAPVKL